MSDNHSNANGNHDNMESKETDEPILHLPESDFLSEDTKKSIARSLQELEQFEKQLSSKGLKDIQGLLQNAEKDELPSIRQAIAEASYNSPYYLSMKERYRVSLSTEMISGVYSEVFTPDDGISASNQDRILINLHGGAFIFGSRIFSHLESIPIADVGKIKVVSVDYRLAPDNRFPSASDDVLTVYGELLKDYKPENIGIYGCSAGAMLTAQAIALFQKNGLPLPGAIGMSCAAAHYCCKGDSGHIAAASINYPNKTAYKNNLYFSNVAIDDPMAFPGNAPDTLKGFPPSLLISATRDYAMSSVVFTHSQLVALGVKTELHILEGLGHAFLFDSSLPESRQVYRIMTDFFDKHLGNG